MNTTFQQFATLERDGQETEFMVQVNQVGDRWEAILYVRPEDMVDGWDQYARVEAAQRVDAIQGVAGFMAAAT